MVCFREEHMNQEVRLLWSDDDGQDQAEYGLLLLLISIAIIGGIGFFGDQIVAAFSRATSVIGS